MADAVAYGGPFSDLPGLSLPWKGRLALNRCINASNFHGIVISKLTIFSFLPRGFTQESIWKDFCVEFPVLFGFWFWG